jgi:anti-sigma-K factor RskA
MDYSRPELADRLAADYVAGTLRGPARRRLEALLPAHPALRTAVREWQQRLVPLTAGVEPVQPSPRVWQRIEARLDGTAAATPAPPVRPGWWQRLALWRGLAAVASVAVIGLSVLLASPGPARPPIVVVLDATGPAAASGGVPASFVASISSDGRAMVTRPLSNVSVTPDRALELWAVPAQGDPRSLGLISAGGTTVLRKGSVLDDTAALAVTLEPPGGSPTGKATGPIVYLGKLQS